MRSILKEHLRRIERDSSGRAAKLSLFTGTPKPGEAKVVVVDPHVSFGRPVLAGTGIATDVVAKRYKAGDSIATLADDYDRSQSEIEEAIRCELYREAARSLGFLSDQNLGTKHIAGALRQAGVKKELGWTTQIVKPPLPRRIIVAADVEPVPRPAFPVLPRR
jgi:uncharacterized protein (DUF433 family)